MKQEQFHIGLGIFVTLALMIVVTSAIVIYKEYLHGKIESYVMFFQGSLNGLEAGSPVIYRGVKIGKVNRIELTANRSQTNVAIPVYVEFFVEKTFVQHNDPIKILIDNGIVASITSPNLLTGKATIQLKAPDKKIPPLKFTTYHGYLRFPTMIVTEDELTIDSTLKTARKMLADISAFIRSKEFNGMINSITGMANRVDTFAVNINGQLPESLGYFNNALKAFSKVADSARNLTDYLSRHPEALLRGKS